MGTLAQGNGFLIKVDDLMLDETAELGATAPQPVVNRLPDGGSGQEAAFGSYI